jgi:hypothetical protein
VVVVQVDDTPVLLPTEVVQAVAEIAEKMLQVMAVEAAVAAVTKTVLTDLQATDMPVLYK